MEISTGVVIALSIVKGIIITFVLCEMCEPRQKNNWSAYLYPGVLSIMFICIKDFGIMCFVVSFSMLLYCRFFLKGSVIRHELLMGLCFLILYISRLVPLIATRLLMGLSIYSQVMSGYVGIAVYFLQFNMTILLFWLCWFISKKQYREWKFEKNYVVIVEIARFILHVVAVRKMADATIPDGVDWYVQVITAALDIMLVITYVLIYILQRTNYEKIQNMTLWDKFESEQEKIMIWQQDYFEARKLRHDINNMNAMYYKMLKAGDVKEVMQLLKTDVADDDRLSIFSNENKMLNAVLNDFAIKCRNEEIIFDVTISEILLDAMEKDVAVILINLLDNAVNASRNSKEKKIKLNIFIHNQMYNIICKNSIDKSVLTDNPYLHTSKRDKNKHGLGILEIQRKLDEYGGIVDFCEEEGYFVAHIMIPCQEELL